MRHIRSYLGAIAIAAAIAHAAPALAQSNYAKTSQIWFPQGRIANINVTSATAPTPLPTTGQIAWVCNTGSVDAYLAFGPSSVTASVASPGAGTWLKNGTCWGYDLLPFGQLFPYMAAITPSSTTTLYVETGIGTPPLQLSGGGGGGGGGLSVAFGGPIGGNGTPGGFQDSLGNFQPFLGDVTNGQWVSVQSSALPSGASTAANQVTIHNDLVTLNTTAGNPLAACAASPCATVIGATPLYQGSAALSATNGLFTNVLQGNAVLSATNGLYGNVLQGNAVLSTSNPLFMTGTGTAGTAATNPITVQGIASMTPILANPGTAANWALGTPAASVPATSLYNGCRGASADPTAVTDGQLVGVQCTLGGRVVTLPYAIKEKMARGTVTTTGAGAATIIAAGSGSDKTYVTALQCWNSSAVTITITLNDTETTGSGTILLLPAGGGSNPVLPTPIVTPAATALTFTPSGAQTTIGCNAQGYYGL